MIFLKARYNIELESDLQLAEREITHLCGSFERVYRENERELVPFLSQDHVLSYAREDGVIGYVVNNVNVEFQRFVKYLSFIQEIWCCPEELEIPPLDYGIKVGNVLCIVPMMAMCEILYFCNKIDLTTPRVIVEELAKVGVSKDVEKSIRRVVTSTPHVHSFHTYKAKFFPRFVRSLMVSNIDLSNRNAVICDPYVGSGTTLVEARLMGFDSVGIDVDPLSCMISRVKSDAVAWSVSDLDSSLDFCCVDDKHLNDVVYEFPAEIKRKFVRWGNEEEGIEYEQQITRELQNISKKEGIDLELGKVSLSDALTKKFNIRMMGTGSGRFALEIAKTSLPSILTSNRKNQLKALAVVSVVRQLYNIDLGRSFVVNGDAVARSIEDKKFDLIITSPPYLPASSGREDYVVGKLISLKAMGLLGESGKEKLTAKSVGSMDNFEIEVDCSGLPSSVKNLYDWLIKDELRSIKAAPIVSYYNSLKQSLMEDKRTLKDNGKIIYIIGKESVFYCMSTKEVLYTVECDKIFVELAKMVGLKVLETINIELDKKSAVARPRSTDKYYECAIILSK